MRQAHPSPIDDAMVAAVYDIEAGHPAPVRLGDTMIRPAALPPGRTPCVEVALGRKRRGSAPGAAPVRILARVLPDGLHVHPLPADGRKAAQRVNALALALCGVRLAVLDGGRMVMPAAARYLRPDGSLVVPRAIPRVG